MKRGVEEREAVNLVAEDGEEALPMMPVKVLLAEGDDSTRHVISALLRKCGYHVSAASDGVKAWEMLKEKSFKIDLVLTEVELPSMSGFLLLSTIMEHDACKNIPVIMMSSNDAVSMVFKCMLKGAADFLVKPIRKNELRNLWQHVWRKQLANGGLDLQPTQQEETVAERPEKKTKVMEAERLIENVAACRNRECSEQESDAQSSCTRSEVEAESKHTNSFLEFKQITGRHSSADPKSTKGNGENDTQTTRNNNLIPRKEGDLSPKRWTCPNDNNSEKASREIEVVHIIDDEQMPDAQKEVDVVRTAAQGNADRWFSIPAHQLELSLRRSDYSGLEDHEKNDKRTLNHSTSSAFSLYNYRPASSFGNVGDVQPCSTSANKKFLHADQENKNGDSAAASQEKMDTAHPPIRVVPFPVPAAGLTFDGQPFWSVAPVAPLLYPQSGPPIWNSETPISQEASTQATSSQQKGLHNGPPEMDSQQTENVEVLPPPPNANEKHLHVEIPSDNQQHVSSMTGESGTNQRHVSPMTGESGTSTVVNNSGNTLSGSACGSSSNPITSPTEPCNAVNGAPETPSMEGSHQLSLREVALNKFRLKRKERCFEKKVRYQSRKLLAEQRPRVKGQFVRQDQSIQGN